MKKTLFTALALGALMSHAQVIYTPNGTTTLPTTNNTGTTAGYVGIGTDTPTATLELKNQPSTSNVTLKLGAVPNTPTNVASSRISFHAGGFIGQNTFPAAGTGGLSFGNNGSTAFTIWGPNVDFGSFPQNCVFKGQYNFNAHVWSSKTTLGSFFSSCPGTYTYPSDGVLDVLGNAYFRNKIILGISKTNSTNNYPAGYRLYVEDGILTERMKVSVKTGADWADYVFAKDYALKSLDSVETYIQANKHLPDVPSAQQVVNEGIDVAKMDAKLLQKIEELTLYMIDMNKKLASHETDKKELEANIAKIQQQNVALNEKIQQLSK